MINKAAKEKSMTYSYAFILFSANMHIFLLARIVRNVPLPAGAWCDGLFQQGSFADFLGGMGDFARRIFPFHDRTKRKRA